MNEQGLHPITFNRHGYHSTIEVPPQTSVADAFAQLIKSTNMQDDRWSFYDEFGDIEPSNHIECFKDRVISVKPY